MQKTIFITGSTDGIGLETAKSLIADGHRVILHGRNREKLATVVEGLLGTGEIESHVVDLSNLEDVAALANALLAKDERLDVLINNAGILRTPNPMTSDGLDIRFVVNSIAPYLLTQKLLPLLGRDGRVVNVSSAAQAPVEVEALLGEIQLADMPAYAQSKLAMIMWTVQMAAAQKGSQPMIVAVNPGSLLASKMVREGFGMQGKDIGIGVDILKRAALSDEFAEASGRYFDNDAGRFSSPHADGLDLQKSEKLVQIIESVMGRLGIS